MPYFGRLSLMKIASQHQKRFVQSTINGSIMISPDFKEFIELLNANNVKYLIVGGYAVAVYGHPRYTKDLDVWLESNEKNVDQLLKALVEFGFESIQLTKEDFLEKSKYNSTWLSS